MSTNRGVNTRLAWCLNSVLNVKVLVAAFNQEKALVGAFSVILQFYRLIVYSTSKNNVRYLLWCSPLVSAAELGLHHSQHFTLHFQAAQNTAPTLYTGTETTWSRPPGKWLE